MKLYLILITMICFVYSSNECSYSLDGNLEMISFTGKNISTYQKEEMLQEGDTLYIKNLTILNTGNCTLTNISIEIWLETPGGKEFHFCRGPFLLNLLEPNQTYSFVTDNKYLLEKEVLTCAYRLSETGTYYMRSGISADFHGGFGYNLALNGKLYGADSTVLIVQPITQLKNLETLDDMLNETRNTAKSSQESSQYALYALIIAGIVGSISIIEYIRNSKIQEEQIKRLDKVAEHIEKTSDKELKSQRKMKFEKDLQILYSSICELNLNLKIIKSVKEDSNAYTSGNTFITREFSYFCLEHLINETKIITSPNLTKKLIEDRNFFIDCNNTIRQIREANLHPENRKALMTFLFESLNKENIDYLKKSEKKLNELYAKLKEKGDY